MLKALELVGFKSFADKTRFEFPPGITVIVGPNGSGKSNVVDAIKWVLGEQSVKSLRGKEMADCIFNGSGARHALNAAETTLIFDNSQRRLAVDAAEVHIARRVYRSGEGEYLINRQPCRLRDIRDLLAGTGVGTEAYSIIEQGKVDRLLQASPRDRRVIFEEAAGISRFKAKKIESLRRLERVEQNLLRLADIVDEVESRLKSVRAQAAKARRYRELADRLQELRTQVGLVDWRQLSTRLAELEAEAQRLRDEAGAAAAQAEALEAQVLELDTALTDDDEALRAGDNRLAENRHAIATRETAIEHERGRVAELDEEAAGHRRRLAALGRRASELKQQLAASAAALEAATAERDQQGRALAGEEERLVALNAQLESLRLENDQRRTAYLDELRAATALAAQASSLESQAAGAEVAQERARQRLEELAAERDALDEELTARRAEHDRRAAEAEQCLEQCAQAQQRLGQLRREQAGALAELAQLRARQAAAAERLALLEELEQRQEGVAAGVKEVLAQARSAEPGPLRHVRGLVAELFRVHIETAGLVDVALGETAGYLVVEPSDELLAYLERHGAGLAGRVGLVRLPVGPRAADEVSPVELEGRPGVLGRADRFVETAPELARLARRLLGRTWVVEKLAHALALSESAGRGLRFVTLAGELLDADGTLVVGPRLGPTGLIWRKSELRALREQLAELGADAAALEQTAVELAGQIEEQDERAQAISAEYQQAAAALAEDRMHLRAAAERQAQLEAQRALVESQRSEALAQQAAAHEALTATQTEQAAREARQRLLENEMAAAGERLFDIDRQRQTVAREVTAAKVELAKQEERLASLRSQCAQLRRDQQERLRSLDEVGQQLGQALERQRQSRATILRAESETAELYLQKEQLARERVALAEAREARRAHRAELAQQAHERRGQARRLEEKLHARELAAGEIRLQRDALAGRLREDYGIELAELGDLPPPLESQREAVDDEIAELRRKLNQLGNVNLDALAEVEGLEARWATLSAQYQDLSSAKASLEQIIHKINADSRRLFAETLETVRGHFQTLFRKLFGGGQADLVLEEGVDILDSGVDIVARPPGKELRNISLLSGGEKTLTCVAILLAIFRSRPSPFCVLDEVDAALDEANIERFVGVLQEFLAWTQFIVVTHSKKTMGCAHTLYGVTMQESGVSKRVAVRFEDVSDNGEIRPSLADDSAEQAA